MPSKFPIFAGMIANIMDTMLGGAWSLCDGRVAGAENVECVFRGLEVLRVLGAC